MHPTQRDRTHAYQSYKLERDRFTRHVAPLRFAPEHRLILSKMRIVPGTYYYRRNVFYGAYGWVTPPYVYTMYPRYGLWDSAFLAFALNHLADDQYAMMIYHHWADPEIRQWVQDTSRLAGDDPELTAKVQAMNDRVSELERAGTARDPSYVPPDAQDVALSPDAIDRQEIAEMKSPQPADADAGDEEQRSIYDVSKATSAGSVGEASTELGPTSGGSSVQKPPPVASNSRLAKVFTNNEATQSNKSPFGRVTHVEGQYVRWDRGSTHGVRPGLMVSIFRGTERIGTGRVLDVRSEDADIEIHEVTGVEEVHVGDLILLDPVEQLGD